MAKNRKLLNYFHILSIICCLLSLFVYVTELIPFILILILLKSSIKMKHNNKSLLLTWSDITITLFVFTVWLGIIIASAVFTMGLLFIFNYIYLFIYFIKFPPHLLIYFLFKLIFNFILI